MIDGHGLSFIKMSEHAKQLINALRQGWGWSHGVGTWPASHGYYVSRSGVLFIMGDNQQIITVMLVKDVKRWRNRRAAEARLRRRNALL